MCFLQLLSLHQHHHEEFVKKLIKANSKEELSDEQVQNEFDNSINSLKYQLIEAKLLEENNIIINNEMLKEFAEKSIRNQMMAYGQLEPTKKDIDSITARIFSNEEEVKKRDRKRDYIDWRC